MSQSTRRGVLALAFGAALALPSLALAQATSPTTPGTTPGSMNAPGAGMTTCPTMPSDAPNAGGKATGGMTGGAMAGGGAAASGNGAGTGNPPCPATMSPNRPGADGSPNAKASPAS